MKQQTQVLFLALALGCSGGAGRDAGAADANDLSDSDGDTISDVDEGRDSGRGGRDSDLDRMPDYRDADSDNDGLLDAFEAGDEALATPPRDSDGDGTPDFLDLDSDANEIPDAREG